MLSSWLFHHVLKSGFSQSYQVCTFSTKKWRFLAFSKKKFVKYPPTTSGSSPKCDILEGWAVHVWTKGSCNREYLKRWLKMMHWCMARCFKCKFFFNQTLKTVYYQWQFNSHWHDTVCSLTPSRYQHQHGEVRSHPNTKSLLLICWMP